MSAPNAVFPSGTPIAKPWYLVDVNGNPINAQLVTEANSAAIKADLDEIATDTDNLSSILAALGAIGDAAWSGSGNGDVIAVLKKLVGNQAGPYMVQGASSTPLAQQANGEGLTLGNLLALVPYVSASGGPPDSTGKPQGAGADTIKTIQGKTTSGGATQITSTLAGDTNLVFTVAPKTLMPGSKVYIGTGANAIVETVIVSQSFVPSSTATTIPLQYPVVTAGSTSAKWEAYSWNGPGTGTMVLDGTVGFLQLLQDNQNLGFLSIATAPTADGYTTRSVAYSANGLYNGTNIDRQRGNLDNISLAASAARTATLTIADQVNYNARGVVICVDTTLVPGSAPSNVVTINGKDPVSGKYQTILTSAAITGVGTVFLTIYPGVTVAANTAVSYPLPRTYQVVVTAGNANSATYSVGASYIL